MDDRNYSVRHKVAATAVLGALVAAFLAWGTDPLEAAPQQTANFDFADFANGGTIGGIVGFEENWDTVVVGGWLNNSGVRLTASGTYKGEAANAYLDSFSSGKPAGLGVCHSITCVTGPNTGDDNITKHEVLTVQATALCPECQGARVEFSDLMFYNADHNPANGDALLNGSLHTLLAGRMVEDLPFVGGTLTVAMAKGGPELYLGNATVTVAPVPLPAAVWLLGAGAAALGAVGTRKRPAAA